MLLYSHFNDNRIVNSRLGEYSIDYTLWVQDEDIPEKFDWESHPQFLAPPFLILNPIPNLRKVKLIMAISWLLTF